MEVLKILARSASEWVLKRKRVGFDVSDSLACASCWYKRESGAVQLGKRSINKYQRTHSIDRSERYPRGQTMARIELRMKFTGEYNSRATVPLNSRFVKDTAAKSGNSNLFAGHYEWLSDFA
jgi:hypothetical protein